MKLKLHQDYLRSSIFGLEDALVSTTGAIVGIAVGSQNNRFILLAGLVIVLVEAISMAAGEFVSEETVNELNKDHEDNPPLDALIMFISYLSAGLVPVLPFMILPLPVSLVVSLLLAFIGLFTLGFVKGKIVKVAPLKSAFKVLFIGGVAAVIGVVVGSILKI